MKIVLDTVTKQAICPPDFFDNIRKINDAAELKRSQRLLTEENYVENIIAHSSQVINPRKIKGFSVVLKCFGSSGLRPCIIS